MNLDFWVGLVMPEPCWRCGRLALNILCEGCESDIPLKVRVVEDLHVQGVYSLLAYEPWIQKILHEIKFNRNKALAKRLGRWISRRITLDLTLVEFVIPVPISTQRFLFRGFNQVVQIWEPILNSNKLSMIEAVKRVMETPPLYNLSVQDRRKVLTQAFAATEYGTLLKNKHVLIVDDIATTGATLFEMKKTIEPLRVASVQVLSLCWVPFIA